jgi:hypothetical protein
MGDQAVLNVGEGVVELCLLDRPEGAGQQGWGRGRTACGVIGFDTDSLYVSRASVLKVAGPRLRSS